MAWIILVFSGVLEAVWATALGRSHGFPGSRRHWCSRSLWPRACAISRGRCDHCRSGGTTYAAWVAIGATLTVLYAMVTGAETVTVFKIVFLFMVVAGVVGLQPAA